MSYPPGSTLALMIIAFVLLRWRPKWARWALGIGIVTLYLATIPALSGPLIKYMETRYAPLSDTAARESGAQAIVILGSGRYPQAPEYGGEDTLSTNGVTRVRYGARLHRVTGLPILVSGGRPYDEEISEAEIMRRVLEEEYRLPTRWVEDRSRNTIENARFSAEMLHKEGIHRVLLVSHSRYMSRAMQAFTSAGLDPIPAPTLFRTKETQQGLILWLPRTTSDMRAVLHEYLGMLYYMFQ
ncbi:hypothetical protein MAIT1_01694 [Magnetofaba australis IT-1]|uniref:DUF218 domain-containing protein n=2 Tax=Magnetofaba TaxID=1472292 RepID=A0A1Y2K1Y9_9PROT|nr:hypothetical protein MAIT1_01694 [Magnetofaba australis IT-1]